MLLGVDVGGTFTDAVLAVDGEIVTAKAPSTPRDQSQGVMAATRAVLERAGRRAGEIQSFSHGMTVATNALLEGDGARTALIATAGFTDLIALGRQARPQLYRLCAVGPEPLTPPERRFGAPERMTPDGPLLALSEDSARWLADEVGRCQPEAVAVALLHSYRHPEHELALEEALAKALPELHVSLSHQLVGTFREYERAATTELDASLSPLLRAYLRRLSERCAEDGIPVPAIMGSAGGLIDLEEAAAHAALTVLSGPAAGAAGAAFVARAAGIADAVCLDMGGTSCDVCVISSGMVQEQAGGDIAGRPVALPMLAVHTVGAGGGSIAWRDGGGALRVGPRSAGADPGPACYGRGGTEPTVTDANLLLGILAGDASLAGVELDINAAQETVDRLAAELSLDPLACAEGILRVANAEMIRALRVVTVQRGIDPRTHALVAFGGAGPLHAAAIAQELGIGTILCPRASGVLAALGLVVSPERRDFQRSVFLSEDSLRAETIRWHTDELSARARAVLGGDPAPSLRAIYELRYAGQSFELAIEAGLDAEPDALRESFESAHEERYGLSDPDGTLELVTIRVSATRAAGEVTLAAPSGQGSAGRRRRARIDGAQVELSVLIGTPDPGATITGPAVVELPESTLLVPEGWEGTVDSGGSIRLERGQ